MRISVIVHRLGPYHVARLNALASLCDLTAIELTAQDSVYAWDKVSQGCAFQRLTLFENLDGDEEVRRDLPRALGRALEMSSPDAVVAPGWGFQGALVALDWCLRHSVPAILMSESQRSDHKRGAFKELLKGLIVRRYGAALVGGRSSADYVAELGMERERIFQGYDVVDNAYFEQGAARARAEAPALRQRLGLPARYWLASNRFIPQKNLPLLLESYARYRGEAGERAYGLVLLGDGPLKQELLGLRGSLGLERDLFLPGFAQYPELPAYYGLASAFIHASTTEPWGLVVNEAMASGLPVLVSRACGCAPDLVHEGRNGYSFDPHDGEALFRAMRNLGTLDEAALGAMGRESQTIINDWAPSRFAESLAKAAETARSSAGPKSTGASRLLLRAVLEGLK